MDYQDEVPKRFWITNPDAHPEVKAICRCGTPVSFDSSILMTGEDRQQPLCVTCALEEIKDHPVTPTYMQWLTNGDPRWWSAFCCNCKGCAPGESNVA